MVKFPPYFVATKYPGYFFNKQDEKLYSMKIDGVLKPLKFYTPNYWNHINKYPVKLKDGSKVHSEGGYYVSVNGRRRFYSIEALMDIEEHDATVPVREE